MDLIIEFLKKKFTFLNNILSSPIGDLVKSKIINYIVEKTKTENEEVILRILEKKNKLIKKLEKILKKKLETNPTKEKRKNLLTYFIMFQNLLFILYAIYSQQDSRSFVLLIINLYMLRIVTEFEFGKGKLEKFIEYIFKAI